MEDEGREQKTESLARSPHMAGKRRGEKGERDREESKRVRERDSESQGRGGGGEEITEM